MTFKKLALAALMSATALSAYANLPSVSTVEPTSRIDLNMSTPSTDADGDGVSYRYEVLDNAGTVVKTIPGSTGTISAADLGSYTPDVQYSVRLVASDGIAETASTVKNFTVANPYATFGVLANGVTVTCDSAAVGDEGWADLNNNGSVDAGEVFTKIGSVSDLVFAGGTVDATEACTSGITSMYQWFRNETNGDTSAWDKNISHFDTSSVTDMKETFYDAQDFNQNISSWCVKKIGSKPYSFDNYSGFSGNTAIQPQWGTCPDGSITQASFFTSKTGTSITSAQDLIDYHDNNTGIYLSGITDAELPTENFLLTTFTNGFGDMEFSGSYTTTDWLSGFTAYNGNLDLSGATSINDLSGLDLVEGYIYLADKNYTVKAKPELYGAVYDGSLSITLDGIGKDFENLNDIENIFGVANAVAQKSGDFSSDYLFDNDTALADLTSLSGITSVQSLEIAASTNLTDDLSWLNVTNGSIDIADKNYTTKASTSFCNAWDNGDVSVGVLEPSDPQTRAKICN